MFAEQEQTNEMILKFSTKLGINASTTVLDIINAFKTQAVNHLRNEEGGKVSYKRLKTPGTTLDSIDGTAIKDMNLFNRIAKKHRVQFALMKNEHDESKTTIWFKAIDGGVLNRFLQDVVELGNQLSKEEVKVEDMIQQKTKENTHEAEPVEGKEPKFKIIEVDPETKFNAIKEVYSFEELKEYLSQNYDSKLKELNLPITSFKEVTSIREMDELLARPELKSLNLKVERKSLIQKLEEKEAEKEKEKPTKEKAKEKDKEKEKEPSGR